MEQLRKELKRLETLTRLRDRKAKRVQELRDIIFNNIVNSNTFLFTSKGEYKVKLRHAELMMKRIDVKINSKIKELYVKRIKI